MKITRLDKIIENNVTYSQQKGNQDQIIYILQDISMTLAMIYDRICGEEPVSESSINITSFIVPFDELNKYRTLHALYIEFTDFPQGYEVTFLRYDESETIDVKHNEKRTERYAVFDAFGNEMRLDENDYNKKWRCWNIVPTKEEREKEKWES